MLIGKVLRSPYPHANILSVDTSEAEKLPGVKAVITVKDLPRNVFSASIGSELMHPDVVTRLYKKVHYRDEYIFNDKARFVGDAIVAVAAVDGSTAERAIELIKVEYEKIPAVFDPMEAMKAGAPRIHESIEHNIAAHWPSIISTGDVEKGWQEADYILEETFYTTKQKHCQLELATCVASFDATGRLTVWSQSSMAHPARRNIARIFNMPEGMVRWLTPPVGGCFGTRLRFTVEPICIALAKKAGKPVKLMDTREEDFIVAESRQPFIQAAKIGVKKDGTITALQAKVIANAGPYFTNTGRVTALNLLHFLGLYRCPNTAGEADIIYTNAAVSGGMRGWGIPSAMFALEQLVDMAAEKIGMEPAEFRLRNIKRTGEPSAFASRLIENSALPECIKVGAEKIGWNEKRMGRREGVTRRGVGMACAVHTSGAPGGLLEQSNAFIKLNEDGSANLVVSPCEMGQGILGVLAQIAAEVLGLNAEDIHVVTGDTDVTLFDVGSHASRSTYVIGNAVLKAAQEVRGQLLEQAAKRLGVSVKELDIKGRQIYVKAAPEKRISIARIARNAIYGFHGDTSAISGQGSFTPEQGSPPFQAVFAEVEVCTETGQMKILKTVIANDSGRAINPMNVEGQLEGGLAQGLGYALTENFVIDTTTGFPITDGFGTYKIPTAANVPDIKVILVEQPVPSGPFGAKGVGELGMNAVAPAIANAIYNAVGVRIKELPITPEKVLEALGKIKAHAVES
jgi:xanthine dehydrogenase molybdenum-binding subunit